MQKLPGRVELTGWLPRHGFVAEIGVDRGDFTKYILENSSPEKLHLIDAWEYQDASIYPETINPIRNSQKKQDENYKYVLSRFESHIHSGQVVVHRGYSADVLRKFPDGYFDWVYIDANHQYNFVKKDLEISSAKVKNSGFICGHDYIAGNSVTGVEYGVVRAVDDFCKRYGWKMICMADHFWEGGNYQSYVLAKRGVRGILRRLWRIVS